MTPEQLISLKRAFYKLGFEGKTYLSRKEILALIEELNLNRDYDLADYIHSLEPSRIFALLGR